MSYQQCTRFRTTR